MNSRWKRAAVLVALVVATFVLGTAVATFTGFVAGAIGSAINDSAKGQVPHWPVPTNAEEARQALFEMGNGYDESELAPVFIDRDSIVRRVLGGER